MDRVILHCDCNSFFASVETKFNPALAKVPMAVSGDPTLRHGIILAKNELAKKYDIKTAETIWSAKRKCPSLVLVKPHYDEYVKISEQINKIYLDYTDLVEKFGIDESWLDVTGSTHLFGDGVQIADTLRRRVREECGVTISVGVSFNKVFAKLGSDYKKPDATTVINRENFKSIAFTLPASDLLMVGQSTADALAKIGVKTIGDLAAASPTLLTSRLGKMGEMLRDYANGSENSPVASFYSERENKSVSHGITFKRDLVGFEEIRIGVVAISDLVAARLRALGVCAAAVQLSVKDSNLQTITRQKSLAKPTQTAREITELVMEIFAECWNNIKPVRTITIGCTSFLGSGEATEQLSFFAEEKNARLEKVGKVEKTLDDIRLRYGRDAIVPGSVLDNDFGIGEQKDE